jgi:hypothetical protein
MCPYICSVIIQVIVTVMKKQPLKKGIRGEKERRSLSLQKKKELLSFI